MAASDQLIAFMGRSDDVGDASEFVENSYIVSPVLESLYTLLSSKYNGTPVSHIAQVLRDDSKTKSD